MKSFLFRTIIIILLTCTIISPVQAADTAESNIVQTVVGNAVSTANNDISKAAIHIIEAFKCTFNVAYPLVPCVENRLRQLGYSDNAIRKFLIRGQSVGSCAQCLGYVALALTLATEGDGILLGGFGDAAAVLNVNSFPAGKLTFRKLPDKNIQPGDVGVIGKFAGEGVGSAGHILIVRDVPADTKDVSFTAYESNWGSPLCNLRDNYKHNKLLYTFYRP